MIRSLLGHRVYIVPSWAKGWVRFVQPPIPPRGARKGTRRQWKRAHPQGWRLRTVEPAEMMMSKDTIYCTTRQYAALRVRLDEVLVS